MNSLVDCFPPFPKWVYEEIDEDKVHYTDEEKMDLVIHLSRRNVIERTGGPFGAGIFVAGRLVAPGINMVVPLNNSLLHAENVALMVAEQRLSSYTLKTLSNVELVTSAQPCIQCFGATWWAAPDRLVIGANNEDVECITGFQEGPLPEDWVEKLETREPPNGPTTVIRDILREQAIEVLELYVKLGGEIYNPSKKGETEVV